MIQVFATKFLKKLQEYKKVALFVHINPDFDAYASAFGVRQGLRDNFPDITSYLIIPRGTIEKTEEGLFKHDEDLPNGEDLRDALGIVLDTPLETRILTNLYTNCKEIIAIDHHPKVHTFSELEFIDPTYPAVSQMLAEIFMYLETEEGGKYIFRESLAQYFYAGIITDTNKFLSDTMLPSTFKIVSDLVSRGINREIVHKTIFTKPLSQNLLEMEMLRHCRLTSNGLAFVVVTPEMITKYKLKHLPNLVSVLENIPNIEVGSTLTYEQNSKKGKCSIRSKNLNINQIAKLYGGGGHKKVSAVSFSYKRQYYSLLATLDDYLINHSFANVTVSDHKNSGILTLTKLFNRYKKM